MYNYFGIQSIKLVRRRMSKYWGTDENDDNKQQRRVPAECKIVGEGVDFCLTRFSSGSSSFIIIIIIVLRL